MDKLQEKNDNEQNVDKNSFDSKYNSNDLDYLKQLGDIAREFQNQFDILKKEEIENAYQRKK